MFLSGCMALRPPAAPGCGDLLGYYETCSLMDSERRKQALKTADETWSLTQETCDQLRLALLLSQPDSPAKERKRALRLISDLLSRANGMDRKARQLARLLRDQLEQYQSRQAHIRKLGDQLDRERATSVQLLQRLQGLQSQLEQLKNIEKNINEKERAIITPSTDNIPP